MSIATELTNYKTYLTNAYNKCAEREAVIPANRNMQNITNCIDSINRYTELTYIESSGTQYIDTGIKPNANIHCVVDFQLTDIPTQSQGIIGGWQASKGMLFGVRYANSVSNFQFAFGTSAWAGNTITADLSKHTLYMNDSNGDARLDNNVLASHSNVVSLTNTSYNIWLMKLNGSVTYSCSAKIFSCKIYNKDTLVRDLIPVLDANNVACMYDKVNNVFYYNQGTGTFVAGDVVLDYIESTGTQYLNTSVASEVNTKVNMKVMFPQISSSDAWFFGINYTNNFLVSLGVYASYPRFSYKSPNYVFSFSPTISTNTKYQVEAYFGASSQYVKVDGTTRLSKTESLVNGSNQGSFRLFNRLDQGDTNLNMRLYSCKIYKDDVLVADFIPVLKADTGEPCLYDKTRNVYKLNSGSGTFLFG